MHIERITSTLALGLAIVAAGCPREQDEPPILEGTTGGNQTAESHEGTTGTTVAMPDESTTVVDPSADSTSDSGGVDCEEPDGCWSCAPTTPAQVLNACTDATCEAFPNTPERLPLLERDGSLPPIP